MAAGQVLGNTHRFSELLERRVAGLEVINLGLEGSGTDQQLLLYQQIGLKFEHDAVLLLPFLQNIRRNMVEAREGIDPRTRQQVLRGKPRFELVNGELQLRNVPVPKHIDPETAMASGGTDSRVSFVSRLKSRFSALPGAPLFKRAVYAVVPWEPFPEYKDAYSAEWQLMAALIRRLKTLAGTRPLVVAPTFYASYVRFRMARNQWDRYSSLAETPGIHPIDLLPHFRRLGVAAQQCFQEPFDMHFSAYGHLVLADALEEELAALGLLRG
jgi:carbamoyltransferase